MRYRAVQAYRPLLNDRNGVNLLREFLTEGDTAARRYALCVLDCNEVKPSNDAPGYAAAQRALRKLVPALVAASFDEDVTVRTRAISQSQQFATDYPEVITRCVEMVGSDVFSESHNVSTNLFHLAPEHRRLIGERHLKFYADNAPAFRVMGSGTYKKMWTYLGDEHVQAMDLLSAAVEGGVRSTQLADALFEILNDSKSAVDCRARAAHLLAVHFDTSARLVPNLIDLLQSDTPYLNVVCATSGHSFADDFRVGTQAYDSFRAAIFDILGKIGPDAKDAVPVLNEYLDEFINPTPIARAQNRTLDKADHQAIAEAIEALSKIGLNAKSIPTLKFFLQWPVMKSVKPDIATLASRALRSSPENELERLRGQSTDKSPIRQ